MTQLKELVDFHEQAGYCQAKSVRVSVGAARRDFDSAERSAAGKGARQRGGANPCRRAPFGFTDST